MLHEKPILVKNIQIYGENEKYEDGYIIFSKGVINEIGDTTSLTGEKIQQCELLIAPPNSKLIPGMIDIHIHGAFGADTMDATIEAIETMATTLPKEGTTSFLATTITQSSESIESALKTIAYYKESDSHRGAEVLGVHLEGPFISTKRAGAQPTRHIQTPNVQTFKKWQEISNNHIKLVTLAPEIDGSIELIQYLTANDIISSLGHSDANYEEVKRAIEAGASHVTHLFNAMSGIHHREPGLALAALLQEDLVVEIIADGNHIHPEVVQLAHKTKSKSNIILITDSIRAKGLKPGIYDLGGQNVKVDGKKAILPDGTLAGSILSMQQAVINFQTYTNCDLEDIIQMTSSNPAKRLKLYQRKGSIAKGKDADLVLLNENHEVTMTFCRGILAYRNGGELDGTDKG